MSVQSAQQSSFIQTLYEGPSKVTIFGREPSVWMGIIESALATLTAFGIGTWAGLSQETYGTWVILIAAIFGFITAFLTKDTMLAVTLGLVKAIIAFVAIYGLTLTDNQTGSIIAFVPLIVALFQRTQTTPIVAGEPIPRDAPPLAVTVVPSTEYPPGEVTSEPPAPETTTPDPLPTEEPPAE